MKDKSNLVSLWRRKVSESVRRRPLPTRPSEAPSTPPTSSPFAQARQSLPLGNKHFTPTSNSRVQSTFIETRKFAEALKKYDKQTAQHVKNIAGARLRPRKRPAPPPMATCPPHAPSGGCGPAAEHVQAAFRSHATPTAPAPRSISRTLPASGSYGASAVSAFPIPARRAACARPAPQHRTSGRLVGAPF